MLTARTKKITLGAAGLALVTSMILTGCAAASETAASETTTATSSTSASTATSTYTTGSEDATTTSETISDVSAAASAFLATLSEEQRETVLYAYDDETKTTSWSNFPVTFVERAGLNLNDLTSEQRAAAMAVLEALLDDEAYATVTGIIGGDEYLLENSSSTETSLGQYYIAFFGDPTSDDAFEVQFGGHHLGINATLEVTEGAITFAPTHLGVQPAVYTDADGNEVQPFDGIYTDAFAFFDSLTAEQQATLTSGEVSMCAPGDSCVFSTGDGLTGADLTDDQGRHGRRADHGRRARRDRGDPRRHGHRLVRRDRVRHEHGRRHLVLDLGPERLHRLPGAAGIRRRGRRRSVDVRLGPRPHDLPRPERRLCEQRDAAGGGRHVRRARGRILGWRLPGRRPPRWRRPW
jgi:hypothetical protein